jgi:hypothetical protein
LDLHLMTIPNTNGAERAGVVHQMTSTDASTLFRCSTCTEAARHDGSLVQMVSTCKAAG